jgi:hypothetical protein
MRKLIIKKQKVKSGEFFSSCPLEAEDKAKAPQPT